MTPKSARCLVCDPYVFYINYQSCLGYMIRIMWANGIGCLFNMNKDGSRNFQKESVFKNKSRGALSSSLQKSKSVPLSLPRGHAPGITP